MTRINAILCAAVNLGLLIVASCSVVPQTSEAKDDIFWADCSWLTEQEFDELDRLQAELKRSDSPKNDRSVFEKYINILNLSTKSDEQLLECTKSSAPDRQRLMQHFVFMGLSYGQGEFSFVDNPRLASLLEMSYFYNYPSRMFRNNSLHNLMYFSNANQRLARYVLGGLIAMQASINPKHSEGDVSKIADNIAKGLLIIKYGRTSIFNKVLFDLRNELPKAVSTFLLADGAFVKSALLHESEKPKVYPMFLKEDRPYWPKDYSEVFAENHLSELADNVFGVNTSPGGTALLTGFFAKRKDKILFFTAGHWQFNNAAFIMQQKNSKPFGKEKSELVWINDQLDLFNFSESLVLATIKALDLDNSQITNLKAKIGTNPFGGSFRNLHFLMPWLDMAIALPSDAVLRKAGIKPSNLQEIGVLLEPKPNWTTILSMGFGITEDLVVGDLTTEKSPGLRRLHHGVAAYLDTENQFLGRGIKRLVTFVPRTLKELEKQSFPTLPMLFGNEQPFPTLSMLFGPRCSGAPFFGKVDGHMGVVGLLQGDAETEGKRWGMRIVHFSAQNLALIDALIAQSKNFHSISEAELTDLVRKHLFADHQIRNDFKRALIKAHQ